MIQEAFAAYFGDFVPILVNLLTSTGAQSTEDKELRARTIETIGSIITAVSAADDKAPFQAAVVEIA